MIRFENFSLFSQYIRDNYGEDPADYNKACTDLEQLRQVIQIFNWNMENIFPLIPINFLNSRFIYW